jgi:hypothetical protein
VSGPLGCGLPSWRQNGALQSWIKEMGPAPAVYIKKKGKNNLEERRLDLAVLEKGAWTLQCWRKEIGTCSVGERRLDLAVLENGDRTLRCWRKEMGSQSWREMTRSWSPVEI